MSEDSVPAAGLNPTAAPFTPPPLRGITPRDVKPQESGTGPSQNGENGIVKQPKKQKGKEKAVDKGQPSQAVPTAEAEKKLSGAELKKLKAAEKAARRAEKVAEKRVSLPSQHQPDAPSQSQVTAHIPSQTLKETKQRRPSAGPLGMPSPHHKRTPSQTKPLPLRLQKQQIESDVVSQEPKKLDKRVPMFSHLYPNPSSGPRGSLSHASKDVHPSILHLGIQLRDHVICGSTARLVATLLAFKAVISAYTTPLGLALSRDLLLHLSHQISHLSHARPLSVSQGNAIRWLKKLISTSDVDTSEITAKNQILDAIDAFIREKVTLAHEIIVRHAIGRIKDGDCVLVYAKSAVVTKALLAAKAEGKNFKVVVADSRPMFEGRNTAKILVKAGIPVSYCLVNGIGHALRKEPVTTCLLGAHAMMANGSLYSRCGTALVAMMAKEADAKVLVLCESIKFTGKTALDSIVMNEVGDEAALVDSTPSEIITSTARLPDKVDNAQKGGKKGGGKKGKDEDKIEEQEQPKRGLEGWEDQKGLMLLNLMYDVTPVACLDMVITEVAGGVLAPRDVPMINGLTGADE